MDARELRVWHWNRLMAARRNARRHLRLAKEWESKFKGEAVYNRHRAHEDNKTADWHLSAVQVLNDHPDCLKARTTAEYDSAFFRARKKK